MSDKNNRVIEATEYESSRMSFTFTLSLVLLFRYSCMYFTERFAIFVIPVSACFMYRARQSRCRRWSLQRFNCWVLQFIPSGFSHKLFPVFLFLLGVVYGEGLEVIEVGWIVTCHEKLVTYYLGIFLVILCVCFSCIF